VASNAGTTSTTGQQQSGTGQQQSGTGQQQSGTGQQQSGTAQQSGTTSGQQQFGTAFGMNQTKHRKNATSTADSSNSGSSSSSNTASSNTASSSNNANSSTGSSNNMGQTTSNNANMGQSTTTFQDNIPTTSCTYPSPIQDSNGCVTSCGTMSCMGPVRFLNLQVGSNGALATWVSPLTAPASLSYTADISYDGSMWTPLPLETPTSTFGRFSVTAGKPFEIRITPAGFPPAIKAYMPA